MEHLPNWETKPAVDELRTRPEQPKHGAAEVVGYYAAIQELFEDDGDWLIL
jgi:hypothetical protein